VIRVEGGFAVGDVLIMAVDGGQRVPGESLVALGVVHGEVGVDEELVF
jgi:hypothetical protein